MEDSATTLTTESEKDSTEEERVVCVKTQNETDGALYDQDPPNTSTSSDDCMSESDSEDDEARVPFIRWRKQGDEETQAETDQPVFRLCGKTLWIYGSLVAERKICFPFLGCSCCCFWTALCCLVNVIPAIHEHTL